MLWLGIPIGSGQALVTGSTDPEEVAGPHPLAGADCEQDLIGPLDYQTTMTWLPSRFTSIIALLQLALVPKGLHAPGFQLLPLKFRPQNHASRCNSDAYQSCVAAMLALASFLPLEYSLRMFVQHHLQTSSGVINAQLKMCLA